jgi:hypothetical protein
MSDDTTATFPFPAVGRKKITAAFDGGRLSSDGGVMLLARAERRLGIAERLARLIPDQRHPTRVRHAVADMLRARIFAIACGYEDCNDFGPLCSDPAFKLACGRLPETGADLASQPTLSRLENAPTLRDAIRLTYALVDQWMASYATPPDGVVLDRMASYATVPDGVVLDIDDTCDVVHGHQQLSLFNAHYNERCFLPIHVYDTATGRPVAVVLRPGKTPSGVEVRGHLRRLVRRIRMRWPLTRIPIRGDSHYARPALCPSRSPGLLRAERPQQSVRTRRHPATHSQSPECGGCGAHSKGCQGSRGGAGFRRDKAPGQKLVVRAPCGGPHRWWPASRPRASGSTSALWSPT